jgi:type III pantothenate kinase
MILTFDVGNTETVIGLHKGEDLIDHWRISTEARRTVDETGLLIRGLLRESGFNLEELSAACIGSVVPPATPILVETCERHLGLRVITIDARSELPIKLDVDEPMTVGADRIVNTLAAAHLYKRDTIAVDLGTATTFDCITHDGVFVGGIIAPGVSTAAETLVRRTSKLPRVDLQRPETVIGRRTETCISSGIFYGAVEAVDGLVRRIKEEWERPDALVVATGGLGTLIGPHCKTVDRVEPFLTLYGLQLAYSLLEEKTAGVKVKPVKKGRGRGELA